jgi:hypothetical protein
MDIVSDNQGVRPEEVYSCEKCNFFTPHKGNYNKHLKSNKHRGIEKEQKKYSCVDCNYHTTYKTDYTRHMAGERHLRIIELLKNNLNKNQCPNCKKQYDSSSAFCKHKLTCIKKSANEDTHFDESDSDNEDDKVSPTPASPVTNAITPEIVLELIQQNRDLQKIILEQNKNQNMTNSHNTSHSHNNTVNNNQTFNLQFFLNEHCKDAIDIKEFVNTLNYSTENLEKNMKLGYTKGISKMFTDGISILPAEKRPMHCSDEKREKLYIRHNGTWISGNDSKERLTQVIADIANNNYKTFQTWALENPECRILDTPAYQKYMTIYQGVIGSRSDEEEIKDVKKILSNIMDQIVIDKEKYLQ